MTSSGLSIHDGAVLGPDVAASGAGCSQPQGMVYLTGRAGSPPTVTPGPTDVNGGTLLPACTMALSFRRQPAPCTSQGRSEAKRRMQAGGSTHHSAAILNDYTLSKCAALYGAVLPNV